MTAEKDLYPPVSTTKLIKVFKLSKLKKIFRNLASSERKREAPSGPSLPILAAKKSKVVGSPTPLGRPTSSSPGTSTATSSESWETVALDVEPFELVTSVLDAYQAGQLEKAVSKIMMFLNNSYKFYQVLIWFLFF